MYTEEEGWAICVPFSSKHYVSQRDECAGRPTCEAEETHDDEDSVERCEKDRRCEVEFKGNAADGRREFLPRRHVDEEEYS